MDQDCSGELSENEFSDKSSKIYFDKTEFTGYKGDDDKIDIKEFEKYIIQSTAAPTILN